MTMAAGFSLMWLITMYQLWLMKPPMLVAERDLSRNIPVVG